MLSIFTLYIIICGEQKSNHLPLLFWATLMGVCCNVFIVGINQVADAESDKINKPSLPIPSGRLSPGSAQLIVLLVLCLSLFIAAAISPYLFYIILLANLIGWAYSMPPFHFKKHHLSAALCISMVRGPLIHFGGFLVFNHIINKQVALPFQVQLLGFFILLFSFVIAWFKDLPDVKGDKEFGVKSLPIVFSLKGTYITGHILLVILYLINIALNAFASSDNERGKETNAILLYGHVFLLLVLVIHSFFTRIGSHSSVKGFYRRFWLFFFAEYLLYLGAYWK